jgi:hypothetical protein
MTYDRVVSALADEDVPSGIDLRTETDAGFVRVTTHLAAHGLYLCSGLRP